MLHFFQVIVISTLGSKYFVLLQYTFMQPFKVTTYDKATISNFGSESFFWIIETLLADSEYLSVRFLTSFS